LAVIKFTNSKSSIKKIIEYITGSSKTEQRLISGKDCMPESALAEMQLVKNMYGKNTGRQYIHIVQSFDPKDNLTHEKANEIGMKLAEKFIGFQAIIATHKDRDHIHNHVLLNSVNFENGLKFQQSKKDMQGVKYFSDKLCLEHGLSIIEKPSSNTDIQRNEYQVALKGESWKIALILTIDKALEISNSKNDFILNMKHFGFDVSWEDKHKYITYTTPEGKKCRDSKLHDNKYLKEAMEFEFRKIEKNTHRKTEQPRGTNNGLVAPNRETVGSSESKQNTNIRVEKESIRERLEIEKAKIKRQENEKRANTLDISNSGNSYSNRSDYKYNLLR